MKILPPLEWRGTRAAAGEDILNATIGARGASDGTLGSLPTVIETFKTNGQELADTLSIACRSGGPRPFR